MIWILIITTGVLGVDNEGQSRGVRGFGYSPAAGRPSAEGKATAGTFVGLFRNPFLIMSVP